MGSVILYKKKRRISLTLEGGYNRLNRNMAMHDHDFKVFKGTQTLIEFIVRDTDRKPINLTGVELVITLINEQNHEVIATVPLEVSDAARGIARFTVNPRLIQDIPLGTYQYTVSYFNEGMPHLLNMDQYDTVHGFFEVLLGSHPERVGTQMFTMDDFHADYYNGAYSYFLSPNFRGNMIRGSTFGLHTIAFYLDHFKGSIWVEGSIQNDVPSDTDWFPIELADKIETRFDNCSGICIYNIEANLMWVRVKILQTDINPGKLTKVLFRN